MGAFIQKDPRPTFQEAYTQIVLDSDLRRLACGETSVLSPRQAIAYLDMDMSKVHHLIDLLCRDLTIITGKKIVRKSRMFFDSITFDPSPEGVWENFIRRYQNYVKMVLSQIKPEPKPDNPVLYPISKVTWVDETTYFDFPSEKTLKLKHKQLRHSTLTDPEELELPDYVRSKLYSLQNTHFNLQPRLIKSKDGEALVINLGNYWNDYAVATWTGSYRKTWKNLYTTLLPQALGCFFGAFVVGYGGYLLTTNQTWWGIILGIMLFIITLAMVGLGSLLSGLLLSNKFLPMKV